MANPKNNRLAPSALRQAGGANLGFESELWRAADALRSNMDAAEYKHVVLGLIFLKYISDAFEEQRAKLEADRAQGADPEDPDEYRAVNIFWVPKEARWPKLKSEARQPTIGKVIDDAMLAIERDNPSLKGVAAACMASRKSMDARDKMDPYQDIPGFCKTTTIEEIRKHGYVLTPGRYVGATPQEDDGEPFEEKMQRLVAALREQTDQAAKLDKLIWANLEDVGYGG